MKTVLLVALLFSSVAVDANSQTIPLDSALQLRTRVRVFTPTVSSGRLAGKVEVVRYDSAFVWVNGGGLGHVPLAAIDSVQVSRGKRHLPAAFLGLWVGAAAGAAILGGAGIVHDAVVDQYGIPAVAYGLLYGVLIGAPVGAVVMGARGFEAWTTVWLPRSDSSTTRQSMRVGVSEASAW